MIAIRDGKAWFFKLTGDRSLALAEEAGFLAFVKSAKFGDQEVPKLTPPDSWKPGRAGQFHTRHCAEYGTQMVGGVTPGKSGETVEGLPVFDTCAYSTSGRFSATSSVWRRALRTR